VLLVLDKQDPEEESEEKAAEREKEKERVKDIIANKYGRYVLSELNNPDAINKAAMSALSSVDRQTS